MIGFACLLVIALVAFWKAEAVGRIVQGVDRGRLGRSETDFGADSGAYVFFVRISALPVAIAACIALVRIFLA